MMDTSIYVFNRETGITFVFHYFQLDNDWNLQLDNEKIFLERHGITDVRAFHREIRFAAYKYECDHGFMDCEYNDECHNLHITPDELEALYDQHEEALRNG